MPAVDPSHGTSRNQEQLVAILIPIFVMLGAVCLSYGIYTALKWLPLFRPSKSGEATSFGTDKDQSTSVRGATESQDVKRSIETSLQASKCVLAPSGKQTTIPPPISRVFRPTRAANTVYLGRDAILARKETETQKNAKGTSSVSENFYSQKSQAQKDSRASSMHLEMPKHRFARGKENRHVQLIKPPLKKGHKPLLLGATSVVALRVPERAVHPLHGYRYI